MSDTAKADAYRRAAEQGDPEAQFNLACAYANGRGVPQNDAEAMLWYRKAAAQGHTGAQNNMGWMYDIGRGVSKDLAEALKWYRTAADLGNPYAQNNLGLKYENGTGVTKDLVEAARWYRLAAQQGHAQAEENLARVERLVGAPPPPSAPSPQERGAPPPPSEGHRAKPPSTSSDGYERQDCKPLLDTCTPLVYRHNAFRVSGLLVDSSTRDIKRRLDDLKIAEEMGDAAEEHQHVFALDPPPAIEHIREAAQRLNDPERRIVDEFFWFWPEQWGSGRVDQALLALSKGDKDSAFKAWSRAISSDHSSGSLVAKHNLAVMYHLVALDSEHVAMGSDLAVDQLATVAKYWRRSFRWWEELTDNEAFWSLVTERIRMLDDPRLTTGFARRMRATLPEALDKINAMLAIQFVEHGKLDLATNHITYMKETHQGMDDVSKTLALVTRPLRTRVGAAVEKAKGSLGHSPETANAAAEDLLSTARDPLRVLEMVLPADSHDRVDIFDSVASTCLECATAFARATERWDVAFDIIEKCQPLARGDEVKTEIEEAKTDAQARKDLSHPKVREVEALIHRVENLDRLDKIKELYRVAPSLLYEVRWGCGSGSRAYQFCSDSIAGKLRDIAVELHNAVGNSTSPAIGVKLLTLSLEIHERASSLACSPAMKARFREDESALRDFRASLNNRGMRETVRRDLLREGLLPLWDTEGAPPPVPEQYRKEDPGRGARREGGQQRPPPVSQNLRREHVATPVGASTSTQSPGGGTTEKSTNAGWLVMVVIGVIGFIIYAASQGGSGSSTPSTYSSSSSRPSSYTPRPAFNQPAQALPYNGAMQRYTTAEAVAPLRIVTRSSGEHYYVKIEDYSSGQDVATVFVRGGSSVDVEVPLGSYRLKYAAGTTWYGPQHLFGPHTSYSKADQRFDFQVVGDQVSGYTVELYMQRDGNLRTSHIAAAEF